MKRKVFLVSDVHIKNRLWTNFSAVTGDSYTALSKITSCLSPEDFATSVCISCGDFFDSNRPSPQDLYEASAFINKFSKFAYIAGNHDDASPYLPSTLSGRCCLLNTDTPTIVDNLYIFGVSHTPSKELLIEKLQQISEYWNNSKNEAGIPIIILHQALEGLQGNAIISPNELEEIFNFPCKIFIGDTHVNVNICKNNCDIFSPGSLVPQNKAEALQDNYIYVLDSLTGDISRVTLKIRHFVLCEDTSKLPSFPEPLELPTVCLVRASSIPAEWKTLYPDVIFIEYPVTKKQEQETVTTVVQDMSLKEAVYAEFESALPEKSDLLCQIFDRIENMEDPTDLLNKLLTKWGVICASD